MRGRIVVASLLVAAGLLVFPGLRDQPAAAVAGDADILFVGDSFTHGRYQPVRAYKAGFGEGDTHVHDLNCLAPASCPAMELPASNVAGTRETGPFGGVPGIVLELLEESGIRASVAIQARSASTLTSDTRPDRLAAIAVNPLTRRPWSAVVLQEQSYRPLAPMTLSNGKTGNPAAFAAAVGSIARAITTADRHAGLSGGATTRLWLYETWPLAAFTYASASIRPRDFPHPYLGQPIEAMAGALHASDEHVAASSAGVAGVAPVGVAWVRAIESGVAQRDPYRASRQVGAVDLWDSDVRAAGCSVPIGFHASAAGSYLAALTVFDRITDRDAARLGGSERAATALGIAPELAVRLQAVAEQAVMAERPAKETPSR